MHVVYAANELEYVVQVYDRGELIDDYRAGNSPRCSQTYVTADRGVGLGAMQTMARQTALEMATDYGTDLISYDADLLE